MPRYHFDLRNGDEYVSDDQGTQLIDVLEAQVHATRTLLNLAELLGRGSPVSLRGHQVSVEVRDDEGLVLQASLTWGDEKNVH